MGAASAALPLAGISLHEVRSGAHRRLALWRDLFALA
jgi:hypothetical protein